MYIPNEGKMKSFKDHEDLDKERAELTVKQKSEHPVFEKGETVTIKGAPFRIESLGSHLMTLRPMPRK